MMSINDVDWEGEWIILFAFALQLAYSIWLVVESWKGLQTKMEISSIIFQFAIQYIYIWYFVQQGMSYSAIGIGILSFAAVLAFILASRTRRHKTRDYHHKHKKCGKKHEKHFDHHSPSKVHPASHPDYIRKQNDHHRLFNISKFATTSY